MGMNRLNDAMYEFWKEGMLSDRTATTLAAEFSKFTVKEVLDLRDQVIQNHISRASLSPYESHRAMQVVKRARKLRYTYAGNRIVEKSKYQEQGNNQLREEYMVIAPPTSPRTVYHGPKQNGKRIEKISNLPARRPPHPPAPPPPPPPPLPRPPQMSWPQPLPKTPSPPGKIYSKSLYAILNLKPNENWNDKSIVQEIEKQYLHLTGAEYPFAKRNMKVHMAARILHWRCSRILYGLRGDTILDWILERIPIVNRFVAKPRLSVYEKNIVMDQDIQVEADANNWSGGGF
jgi:hypothetical protein